MTQNQGHLAELKVNDKKVVDICQAHNFEIRRILEVIIFIPDHKKKLMISSFRVKKIHIKPCTYILTGPMGLKSYILSLTI